MKNEKSNRSQKAESLIIQVLSREFQKEVLVEFGIITISRVKVSSDLQYADIFISSLNKDIGENLINFLNSKLGFFQKLITLNFNTKMIPRLRFYYENMEEKMKEIEILEKLLKE